VADQSQGTRRDLELKLIKRAWQDEKFAQELRSNPKAVFEREVGSQLPANVNVKVVEETAETIYLVLPEKPGAGASELSEQQLNAVAGGIEICAAYSYQRRYSIAPCGWGTGTIRVP